MAKMWKHLFQKVCLFHQMNRVERTIREVNHMMQSLSDDTAATDGTPRKEETDEITAFYSNVLNLQENIKRIEESKAKEIYLRKQAELSVLQSQINPHFLYNTLETIRGLALVYGVSDIADMTKALADLFRYSISSKGILVPLEEELKSVRNYFLIQEKRFNGKFSLVEHVDEDALSCLIPKLLIQPIVENCVHHGLEIKSGKGTVIVEAYLTQNSVLINVKDDGVGIKRSRLEELQKGLREHLRDEREKDGKTHIGLLNVNERIQLNYGTEYGLSIESMEGIGTSVEIILPQSENK